ncbi:MAG: hypothetical protein JNL11_08225 [Bdellovibrionaceae bacterium]|nr:hypothetical protein [Pseudobdellovibrionaceae bacterium]
MSHDFPVPSLTVRNTFSRKRPISSIMSGIRKPWAMYTPIFDRPVSYQ